MPHGRISKSMCVFNALVFALLTPLVLPAQNELRNQATPPFNSNGFIDRGAGQETQVRSIPDYGSRLDRVLQGNFNGNSSNTEHRSLRPHSASQAVTLRPQPMSVQRASFESAERDFLAQEEALTAGKRHALDRLNAENHYQSFIERESKQPEGKKENATELISKIGINLLFVLSLAIGGILLFKQIHKSRAGAVGQDADGLAGLKIDQVLQVTRGVSLYLVDGNANKILVAVDGGGIKSVNLLPGRFEDALDDPQAFSRQAVDAPQRGTLAEAERRRGKSKVDKMSTSEIDDNLIKLLLSKSKKAA